MAVGSFTLVAAAKLNILEKTMNLASDTFVATLLSNGYTPQTPTDGTWTNQSSYEVSGTGYTAGGVALSGQAIQYYLASASIASGGSAYAQSDVGKTVSLSGGTNTTAATITISQVNGGSGTGAVTGITLATGGTYSAPPSNAASTTGGGTTGSGLTITGIWGVQFYANNPSWTSSTITAKYCSVVHRAGGSLASGDLLLGYVDLNNTSTSATVSSTSGTFEPEWNGGASAGVLFTMA